MSPDLVDGDGTDFDHSACEPGFWPWKTTLKDV